MRRRYAQPGPGAEARDVDRDAVDERRIGGGEGRFDVGDRVARRRVDGLERVVDSGNGVEVAPQARRVSEPFTRPGLWLFMPTIGTPGPAAARSSARITRLGAT